MKFLHSGSFQTTPEIISIARFVAMKKKGRIYRWKRYSRFQFLINYISICGKCKFEHTLLRNENARFSE